MKKVLLVVIDALASRVVVPAIQARRLPTFARLVERGTLREACTSAFPSITPAATASIITGMYPSDHHVAGAYWFERDEDHIDYYGDDFWVVVGKGMDEFFNDFMKKLNEERLHAETLYERVERHGLTAAAINFMWFRGDTIHQVNAPLLLRFFPGLTVTPEVKGPRVLALADFAVSDIPGCDAPWRAAGGVGRRFGFHDETTAEYLMGLVSADPFPDLTVAYFPNNDYDSHELGPASALDSVVKVDESLGRFIDAQGGLDAFLQQFAIFITGDHSQCDMNSDESSRNIDLTKALSDYTFPKAGQCWNDSDDLMACPNMRACHIYVREKTTANLNKIVACLLTDSRVDQVIWRKSVWNEFDDQGNLNPKSDEFFVQNADDGLLRFSYVQESEVPLGYDLYGNGWRWSGNLAVLDASLAGQTIKFAHYPNAFERIATGFCPWSGELLVTAKPGFEFSIVGTSIHPGGSHAGLNIDDSTPPLIIAGATSEIHIPDYPRTIDVAPLVLQMLGLDEEANEILQGRFAGPMR